MHECSETQVEACSVAEMLRTGPGACKLRLTATNYSQLNAFNSWKDAHFQTKCIYESAEGSDCIVFPPLPMPRGGSLPLLANSNTIPLPSFLPPVLSSFSIFPLHPGRRGKRIASGRGLLFVTHRNPATRRRVSRSAGSVRMSRRHVHVN